MKKGLFDIILDQIIRERDEPPKASKTPPSDENEEAKTLEEKAKEAVKKREKNKLDELLKKKKEELEDRAQKVKRKVRKEIDDAAKKEAEQRALSLLESPTKNLSWKCVTNGNYLQGSSKGKALFEIKRGVSMFELRPMKNSDTSVRLKRIGLGNIFTAPDVQRLKAKADRLFEQIEKAEPINRLKE